MAAEGVPQSSLVHDDGTGPVSRTNTGSIRSMSVEDFESIQAERER